jgi:TP901 family phage tail tape measure protein
MTESLAIMQGVTPQIRAEMEGMAAHVAKTTKFSMKEAAEGYYSLASAGLDSAVAMRALPIAAQFAQAGVFNLAQSTEYLASATAAMGTGTESATEKVEQMQRVADVLTEANNRALGSVKDFADALTNRGALAMKQSNIELEHGVAILAAYAERGLKGKSAGQQLWMMLRDLSSHALTSSEAFEKHGIAVYNADGSMRGMNKILGDMEKTFNSLTVAQRAAMLQELGIPARSRAATQAILGQSEAIRKHEEALREAGGTAKDVADKQMAALSNQMLRLKNTFEVAANDLFKSFVPVMREYLIPAAETAISVFKVLTGVFASLPGPIKAVMLASAGLVAAIGPMVAILGSMSLLTSAAMGPLAAMSGWFGKIAQQVGLAAGGVDLYKLKMAQSAMATAQAAEAAAMFAHRQATALGNTAGAAKALAVAGQEAAKYNSALLIATPALDILKSRQDAAALAARELAKASGLTGIAITQAGNAARTAEKALQATAIASATAATGFRGVLASIGGLMGPIGWTITALAALAGGVYLLTRREDLLGTELSAGTEEFRKNTEELHRNLSIYNSLIDSHNRQLGLSPDLDKATRSLAESVGLSAEQFIKETKASDDLIRSLGGQLNARNALLGATKDEAVKQYEAASAAVRRLQQEQAKVQGGLGEVITPSGFGAEGGQPSARPMTMDERIRANAKLQNQIDEAKRVRAEAEATLMKVSRMEPRSAKPTGWGMPKLGDDPAFPSMEDGKKKKEEFDTVRDGLLGINRAAIELYSTWNSLSDAEKGNAAIQHNLWEAYAKLRTETGGLIPEFEYLLSNQIQQAEVSARVAESTQKWSNTWSDAANEFIASADKIAIAQSRMSPGELEADFKKWEAGILDSLPVYDKLEKKVQLNIDAFLKWKAALGPGKDFQEAAQRASEAMTKLTEDVKAKNKDLETDILQFTSSIGDTQRRQTRNKLEQITNDHRQAYMERFKDSVRFNGLEWVAYMGHLAALKVEQDKHVANVQLSEDLKYAASLGIHRKILRDMVDMTAEERRQITMRMEI